MIIPFGITTVNTVISYVGTIVAMKVGGKIVGDIMKTVNYKPIPIIEQASLTMSNSMLNMIGNTTATTIVGYMKVNRENDDNTVIIKDEVGRVVKRIEEGYIERFDETNQNLTLLGNKLEEGLLEERLINYYFRAINVYLDRFIRIAPEKRDILEDMKLWLNTSNHKEIKLSWLMKVRDVLELGMVNEDLNHYIDVVIYDKVCKALNIRQVDIPPAIEFIKKRLLDERREHERAIDMRNENKNGSKRELENQFTLTVGKDKTELLAHLKDCYMTSKEFEEMMTRYPNCYNNNTLECSPFPIPSGRLYKNLDKDELRGIALDYAETEDKEWYGYDSSDSEEDVEILIDKIKARASKDSFEDTLSNYFYGGNRREERLSYFEWEEGLLDNRYLLKKERLEEVWSYRSMLIKLRDLPVYKDVIKAKKEYDVMIQHFWNSNKKEEEMIFSLN